ncbi:DHH family phosphoesterase [Macromonas nakdongensis]|uniref:DHH family phosphoesterase n=1 Tax=Macromonas nakdongensis TaxID=1843082 RepID=UPI000C338786|nr:DHHA1 domain-containing protein [Macromonas nakdongensis]
MKDTLVLYHADCPDGFGAAYAAWRALGDRADYLPCQHGGAVPAVAGRDVFILDFAFDADVMTRLRAEARSITLLDHHQTAHDKLQCLHCGPGFSLLFDMQRSGAHLAWAHFHPGQPVPHLISRIEDRDLWDWAYPDTRPFLAALDALDFDFEQWARFHEAAEDPAQRAQIVARGQAVVDRFAQQVQTLAEGAFPLDFMGHRVWAVNAPSEFTSDLGNVLAERSGTFGVIFRIDSPTVVKVSLRAVRPFDASALAVPFGGGGHPQACAFRLGLAQLPALLDGSLRP